MKTQVIEFKQNNNFLLVVRFVGDLFNPFVVIAVIVVVLTYVSIQQKYNNNNNKRTTNRELRKQIFFFNMGLGMSLNKSK